MSGSQSTAPDIALSFGWAELTSLLHDVPILPSLITSLRLFAPRAITTTVALIERVHDQLALVPEQPRGAPASLNVMGERSILPFRIPHFPLNDTLMADSVQDLRAPGRFELQGWSAAIEARLASMGRKLDATEEHLRLGACRGVVITALDRETGAVLSSVDLFAAFGIAPPEIIPFPMAGDAARSAEAAWSGRIMASCRTVARQMQTALQATPGGIAAICGSDFFDALSQSAELRQTFLGTGQAAALREDGLFVPTRYGGISFYDYGHASVGGVAFMRSDEAAFVPLGQPVFEQLYAPADYMKTVNTLGLRRYANQHVIAFGKGLRIETQTNTMPICTNPKCLLTGKLTEAGLTRAAVRAQPAAPASASPPTAGRIRA